ncbi:M23 family metallopeptidase [Thalassococcus sp. CAU 1522]|uniref:M23 family metallopeptidase n=1 Tax=Thalassococcus arenae TaxID=2851652 RepID=A0ABS6N510_9RHOB|nr:M23 family metallopeptidase [Thalassococcus arenae]MBV2359086.1 M23 family metallopeptidase [Thalassococcus arenae]
MRASALILAASVAAPAAAEAPLLTLPIDCTLGETCFIQQFVDHDPGPGATDFACGTLSYDGHQGTDFGLPTHADMIRGVPVLAAAPGTVRAIRNSMPDQVMTADNAAQIEGRDCGNGLVIEHDDGWETQYCHMKQGSVTVRAGDRVERGAVLGQVGLSGRTEFPHIHLSVRHNGETVDPFQPETPNQCDAPEGDSLWQVTPAYVPGGLLDAGFATRIPDFAAVKAGTAAETLSAGSPALVVFGFGYGARAGDVMAITVTGPQGVLADNRATIDRPQAQFFRATGRRARGDWPAGDYTGTVVLERAGAEIARRTVSLAID